jgi:hypothetical protein
VQATSAATSRPHDRVSIAPGVLGSLSLGKSDLEELKQPRFSLSLSAYASKQIARLAWARKAVVACRAPVEVRSFFRSDTSGLLARTPLKEGMTQYLATIYLPDNFDPSAQDKEMESDFDAHNEEMEASGVKEVFAGGLSLASEAKSL